MGVFRSRPVDDVASRPVPRDVESLEKLIMDLDRATDEASAWRITVDSTVASHNFSYGAAWLPDGKGNIAVAYEVGTITHQMQPAVAGPPISANAGLVGRAFRSRKPVYVGSMDDCRDCRRCQAATRAGMKAALVTPVIRNNQTVAMLEYFSAEPLHVDGPRSEKWASIARIAEQARFTALAAAELRQIADDRLAVTNVVNALGETRDSASVLRTALDSLRTAFNWAYGSYWEIDDAHNALRFKIESGWAGEAFRKVTLAAAFAEGVGLSGRAWRTKDLVFIRDIGELTDCVRASAAQQAGVRSGICFKDLARETAEATQRVAEQITGIQTSARTVSAGILTTSETIGRMDAVQARMNDVLEEQARMAGALQL